MGMRLVLLASLCIHASAFALDPTPSTVDPAVGEGCWVQFFAERDFKRPMGMLTGGTYINSLAGPGLIGEFDEREYFQRTASLVVGPEAKLVIYAEPGFDQELVTIGPNRKVPALNDIGFPQRAASLKVLCERG